MPRQGCVGLGTRLRLGAIKLTSGQHAYKAGGSFWPSRSALSPSEFVSLPIIWKDYCHSSAKLCERFLNSVHCYFFSASQPGGRTTSCLLPPGLCLEVSHQQWNFHHSATFRGRCLILRPLALQGENEHQFTGRKLTYCTMTSESPLRTVSHWLLNKFSNDAKLRLIAEAVILSSLTIMLSDPIVLFTSKALSNFKTSIFSHWTYDQEESWHPQISIRYSTQQ